MNVLIIGAGIAGVSCAKRIRANDPSCSVCLIDSERNGLYAKMRLPEFLAGTLPQSKLILSSVEQLQSLGIRTVFGDPVVSLDVHEKRIRLVSGIALPFDRLVLATGATPAFPPIPGCMASGRILALRTMKDAEVLTNLISSSHSALLLGGGLLGLEAAWALKNRGVNVTILESMDRLLPRQLRENESRLLQNYFQEQGFEICLSVAGEKIEQDNISVRFFRKNAPALKGDFLLVSAGIRASTKLAAEAGLAVGRGILVDEGLQTSAAGVYAVGDCAEHGGGMVTGLWLASKDQGEALGDILCGKKTSFQLPAYSPQLKIPGIKLDDLRKRAAESAV